MSNLIFLSLLFIQFLNVLKKLPASQSVKINEYKSTTNDISIACHARKREGKDIITSLSPSGKFAVIKGRELRATKWRRTPPCAEVDRLIASTKSRRTKSITAVNADNCLAMLQDKIIPAIRNIARQNFNDIWFQQDGVPPHYGLRVRQYLNEVFPKRWIGRRGYIEWPARSPDLNSLDYFLWGYLKGKIYNTKPRNLNDLRQRIINEFRTISCEFCRNAVSFYNRLSHCQTAEGRQFEYLL
ncbi:hypothetical protein ALC57_10664 [Trachymyrmex cornetzi]|uniref:Transposable element Tc3 transposase n=1 Tax=Trachymyrmex cornetzi TaxID=471704 RepID=A0A151J3N6_9HYME|nr:hypothetical protein ALC57_10664 [Trachymyrmex cornetzi]